MSGDGIRASNAPAAPALDPMLPRVVEVRRVSRETADTVTLTLADPDSPARFAPGQFNMLYVFGAGESAISMSGDAGERGALVHTVRAIGSVTRPLVSLKAGAQVGVRGPFGRGWPVDEAARRKATILLLAGGIGLAPLRPVVYHFLRNREKFERLVVLYGARSPADLIYRRELQRWTRSAAIEIHTIVDRGGGEWRGRVGVLTDLLDTCRFDPAGAIAMICGPEVMMRLAARALALRGMRDEDIYLSMERNMRCAIGFCGHCQFGPSFVCKDGPIFALPEISRLLAIREV
jgi:NAD(P)H-flavin reductase